VVNIPVKVMARQNWITAREVKAYHGTREITVLSSPKTADETNKISSARVIMTRITKVETSITNQAVNKVITKDKVTGADTNPLNNPDADALDKTVVSTVMAIMVHTDRDVLNLEKVITAHRKVHNMAEAIMVLQDKGALKMEKAIMALHVVHNPEEVIMVLPDKGIHKIETVITVQDKDLHNLAEADGVSVTSMVSATWKEENAEPDLNTAKEAVVKANNMEDDTIAEEIILQRATEMNATPLVTRDSDPTKVIMANVISETVMKTENPMAVVLPVMTEIAKTTLPVQNVITMWADTEEKNTVTLMEIVLPVTMNTPAEGVLQKTSTGRMKKITEKVLPEAAGTGKK